MKDLRETKCKVEIAYFLSEHIQKATEVTLWQKTKHGREIWKGRVLLVKNNRKAILVLNDFSSSSENRDNNIIPSKESTLYIKGEYESLLFKAKISANLPCSVEISIPNKAFVYEKRKNERYTFSKSQKDLSNIVKFSKSNELIRPSTRTLQSGNLHDVSRQGLTLFLNPNAVQNWSPKDELIIYRISDRFFEHPIAAKIVYIKPIRKIKNNRMNLIYRLGLEFQTEINRIQLSSIMQKQIKLSA